MTAEESNELQNLFFEMGRQTDSLAKSQQDATEALVEYGDGVADTESELSDLIEAAGGATSLLAEQGDTAKLTAEKVGELNEAVRENLGGLEDQRLELEAGTGSIQLAAGATGELTQQQQESLQILQRLKESTDGNRVALEQHQQALQDSTNAARDAGTEEERLAAAREAQGERLLQLYESINEALDDQGSAYRAAAKIGIESFNPVLAVFQELKKCISSIGDEDDAADGGGAPPAAAAA